ncbi:queuosine precursor transporter [Pedobacter panaciterrae]
MCLFFIKLRKLPATRPYGYVPLGSTLVSQCIDSFVVIFIAFYLNPQYHWSWQMVAAIGLVNYTYKFVVAILMTPILYVVHGIIDRYLGKDLSHRMITMAGRR